MSSDAIRAWWDSPTGQTWFSASASAFQHAHRGELTEAAAKYDEANTCGYEGLDHGPALLRHFEGHAEGRVVAAPPEEDVVIAINLSDRPRPPSDDPMGMAPPVIDRKLMKRGIVGFMERFQGGVHTTNLQGHADLPHALVLGTGRCGTVSLYHLMRRTHYVPYHAYLFSPLYDLRYEQALRLSTDHATDQSAADFWLTCRAAEWLGASAANRPMIGLMHYDTVFAPAFAALHRHARFVYLHRDPVKVFESFYAKNQWGPQQIGPMYWSFDPEFHWCRAHYDEPAEIAWYIRWTEEFCGALQDAMGPKVVPVSSDALFAGSHLEASRLKGFLDMDLSIQEIVDHFKVPYNAKHHKIDKTAEQMDSAREVFVEAYKTFGGYL